MESEIKVDLNVATVEELETLPGIGPVLAQRVVDYRGAKGAFLSPEEITAVPAIGAALYARLADRLIVTLPEAEPQRELVKAPEEQVPEAVEEGPIAAHAEAGPALVSPEPLLPEAPPASARRGMTWVWSALLGALLGVVCTLLILFAINGSLDLSHTPVVLEMRNDTELLVEDVGALAGEVSELRRRLALLEGLPSRVDSVEEAVDGLAQTVKELSRQAGALERRVEAAEVEVVGLQKHAQTIATFFARLQSLMFDVFGGLEPPARSSNSTE